MSTSSREAGESSKSCTTTGRSRTIKASDWPISISWMSGKSNANATASRSRVSCLSSLRTWANVRIGDLRSVFSGDLALQAGLLHDADENVLEREARFTRAEHPHPVRGERRLNRVTRLLHLVVGDHVQAFAEQRHAPPIHHLLQTVRGTLRIVDVKFKQMATLPALDRRRRAFGHELAGHHQSKPVALLGFLEVVRRDQNGGSGVGEAVDQLPERAASDRIDA